MKQFCIVCLCVLCFCIGCKRVQIHDYDYAVQYRTGQHKFTMDEVRNIIFNACEDKGWTARDIADNAIEASLLVRQKHEVRIRIDYSPDGYHIKYVDSTNMKYKRKDDGTETIHNAYEKWLNNLDVQLKRQFMAPTYKRTPAATRYFR